MEPAPQGIVFKVISDRSEHRFRSSNDIFVAGSPPTGSGRTVFTLDPGVTFQTITGWGGAFTDAAAINYAKLSEGARRNFVK